MNCKLRFFAAALLFAAAAPVFSARCAETAAPVNEATIENFPNADSVVLESVSRIKYNSDGTYIATERQREKILTERGRRENGTFSLSYSKRYGEARIVSVGICGKDGKTRQIEISGLTKEATDNSSNSMNIYDPFDRKITCNIPGLQLGDILEVETERRTFAARVENQFSNLELLELDAPLLRGEVIIDAPLETPLQSIKICNPIGNVAGNVETNGNRILYTWVATNSPQAFPEPDMPPLYTQLQSLRVSTIKNWQELSSWYWRLSLPHLNQTTTEMTNQVAALSRPSRGETMRAIYDYVAKEIRYMGLTMEDKSPGYAPHDVNVTFAKRYGVCRDKAALLVAMLSIAGFDAYPVLINAGAKLDDEVPLPYFNHAIVAVIENGEIVLMDPTDESSHDMFPAYLSDCSYLIAKSDGDILRLTPSPDADKNKVAISSEGTLDGDDALLLDTRMSFTGLNDNAYRHALLRRNAKERKGLFERIIAKAYPDARLLKIKFTPDDLKDTSKMLEIEATTLFPGSVLRGKTRNQIILPQFSHLFGIVNMLLEGSTSLERRKYPLKLSSTAKTEEVLRIDLCGARLGAMLPSDGDVSMAGDYAYSRQILSDDNTLSFKRELAINKLEFTPDEYYELREDIKSVELADRKAVSFADDFLKDADVHILDKAIEIATINPYCWKEKTSVMLEILTYDGKKRCSELKFSFNPECENVEFLYGIVSNRNGKVFRAGEKEMNVLDCNWASAAPRYPASKMLIVNLPSVEIGSVISYSYVSTVTNSPVAFCRTFYKDALSPVDHLSIRCDDYHEELSRLKPLSREMLSPPGELWRSFHAVCSSSLDAQARCFGAAMSGARQVIDKGELFSQFPQLGAIFGGTNDTEIIRGIRDYLYRHIKLAGPSLYELPLSKQLTPPIQVLKDGYASRIDYMNLMNALFKAANLHSEIILAAGDGSTVKEYRDFKISRYPDFDYFDIPLCRVEAGGIAYYIGTESFYTPIGTSSFDGSIYWDFAGMTTNTIELADEKMKNLTMSKILYSIRENGSVDYSFEKLLYGAEVGAFRKKYVEMVPEDRFRHFQMLLGSISQAAAATSELLTDVESYPARMFFTSHIPNLATVDGDTMKISIAELERSVAKFSKSKRSVPIAVTGCEEKRITVSIQFPEQWEQVEYVPETYEIVDPLNPAEIWYSCKVAQAVKDGRLEITFAIEIFERPDYMLPSAYAAILQEIETRISSCHAKTIIVRKGRKPDNERLD